jgi:phosphatidate phosphatase APP1
LLNFPVCSFAKANKFKFQVLPRQNKFPVDSFAKANKFEFQVLPRQNKFEFQVLPRQNKAAGLNTPSGSARRLMLIAAVLCAALLLIAPISAHAALWTTNLDRDDIVQLSESTAALNPDGTASARLHAWVFEREARPGAISLFSAYLDLEPDTLTAAEKAAFEARARLFFVDSKRKKRVSVTDASGGVHALGRTDSYGALSAQVILPGAGQRWLDYSVQAPSGRYPGRALVVPASGVSIVSDVDDTIRQTNVLVRNEMLLNTFVRPLAPVPGMAALYQGLEHENASLRVHYVSNAPFALYPLVKQFLTDAQFPEGSMHLRAVSFKGSLWHALAHPHRIDRHKTDVIEALLADFPGRRFILIGDTGEQDPAVYADLARAHPKQIALIALRSVRAEESSFARNMLGVAPARWLLFKQPSELRAAVARSMAAQ